MDKKNYYTYNHFLYYWVDYVYGLFLHLFRNSRKHPYINENTICKIKEIESEAYPIELQGYSNINSVEEFVDYCGCCHASQIYYLLTDDLYLIIVSYHNCIEIFDVADRKRKSTDIWKVLHYINNNFKNRVIIADARDSTSFPLIEILVKRNKIYIINDFIIERDGEKFHRIKFKIKK